MKLTFMVMKLKRINEQSLKVSTCTKQLVTSEINAEQVEINSSNIDHNADSVTYSGFPPVGGLTLWAGGGGGAGARTHNFAKF